jgi:RimJ/RimL family protein N-acetyltransferase
MLKLGTVTLETKRLILRRFTPNDAEDMYRNWASDPEVTRFLTWPCHSSPEATRVLLEDWAAKYADGGYFNWGIELKEIHQLIGSIAVGNLNEDIGSVEIGYCLSQKYWGQGLMPEALKEVIRFLFADAGVNRISAYHDVNNPKSGRVMEKSGMKYEGTLRQAGKNNQGICDLVVRAALRSEWRIPE